MNVLIHLSFLTEQVIYSNEDLTPSFSTEELSSSPFSRPQTSLSVFQMYSKGFATNSLLIPWLQSLDFPGI